MARLEPIARDLAAGISPPSGTFRPHRRFINIYQRRSHMRRFGFTAVAAGLIGGAMLLSATAPASAATLAGPAFAAPGDIAMVEQVHSRGGERAHRYDSRRHGQRYRQARSGYRHQHDGYYYSSPWWEARSTIEHGLAIPGAVIHELFR